MSAPLLSARGLKLAFGGVKAADGIDLDVMPGEFLAIIGPNGAGKTTFINMTTGYLKPQGGRIEFAGEPILGLSPRAIVRRGIGRSFQLPQLFSEHTVIENAALALAAHAGIWSPFGPLLRPGYRAAAERLLDRFGIVHLAETRADALNEGARKLADIAMAVALEPRLLLMDEPLGALDKKLREALQLEIMHISRQLGAPVIYVTHDQEEALVMSDRIAIFHDGKIEQLGSGEDLYERPISLFVADFIGESNILHGKLEAGSVVAELGQWRVSEAAAARASLPEKSPAALVVRPERLRLIPRTGDVPAGVNTVDATVTDVLYLGSTRKYELKLANGQPVGVRQQLGGPETAWNPADGVRLAWDVDAGVLVAGRGL